jgi:hypothetical protein
MPMKSSEYRDSSQPYPKYDVALSPPPKHDIVFISNTIPFQYPIKQLIHAYDFQKIFKSHKSYRKIKQY